MEKQKSLNLGPRLRYLDICGLEFVKATVILEISTLEFSERKSFVQK